MEKQITSMLDSDPLIKLKAQEIDLKAHGKLIERRQETEARS